MALLFLSVIKSCGSD